PVRGAGPAGRRRRSVDVPRVAVPDRPKRDRAPAPRPAPPSPGAAGGRRPRGRPARSRGRGDEPRRGRRRVAGGRAPADRSPAGGRPALRRGDVDRRDRRDPGTLRGCRPGPHPPCVADRRARPRWTGRGSQARRPCRDRRTRTRRCRPGRPRSAGSGVTLDRDSAATEALLTDLYLDALLAGAVLDAATAGQTEDAASPLDPAARRAADRLRHDLVRVHPSFRFEERLATRLAEAAVAMRVPVAAGGEGRVVAFRPAEPIDVDSRLIPSDPGKDPGADARRAAAGLAAA